MHTKHWLWITTPDRLRGALLPRDDDAGPWLDIERRRSHRRTWTLGRWRTRSGRVLARVVAGEA